MLGCLADKFKYLVLDAGWLKQRGFIGEFYSWLMNLAWYFSARKKCSRDRIIYLPCMLQPRAPWLKSFWISWECWKLFLMPSCNVSYCRSGHSTSQSTISIHFGIKLLYQFGRCCWMCEGLCYSDKPSDKIHAASVKLGSLSQPPSVHCHFVVTTTEMPRDGDELSRKALQIPPAARAIYYFFVTFLTKRVQNGPSNTKYNILFSWLDLENAIYDSKYHIPPHTPSKWQLFSM